MVQKSFTRVTLALDIVKKLETGPFAGYHELAIIKHQIDLFDLISIENASALTISCDHPHVPCDNRNICWQAVELIKNEFGIDKAVKIHIEKNIPVMGGLAGGSTNAATVLMLLNRFWDLGLSLEQMMEFGRKLGMDVPFYFVGGTAFDTEATGLLKPISTPSKFVFVLAVPHFGVSTKDAYQGIDYTLINKDHHKTAQLIQALHQNEITKIFDSMHNDFEFTVFSKYPDLLKIKQQLLNAGCRQVIMSGSGSTVLGVADGLTHAQRVQNSVDCKTIIASSLSI